MAANKTARIVGYQQLDFRSLSITLLGTNNNTMTGTVNLSAIAGAVAAEPEEDTYDDSGAAYYVCAVILVYGLSIVSLIGSLAKKKMKDNKYEQEEVQIHKYLHKVPDLKEKNARDNYRQLKRDVIKQVEAKTTPTPTPDSSLSDQGGGFHFPKVQGSLKHLDKTGSRTSLDKRQPTPHHHSKLKGQGKGLHKTIPSENQHLLAGVEEDDEEKAEEAKAPEPETTTPGPHTPGIERSLPFDRLQAIDLDPEEKITVVQSMSASKSDPVSLRLGKEHRSQMMGAEEGPGGRPTYRWSLGADGNIWIMQVDEKGEERLAAPPKVESLPAPPSPEYVPKFAQRQAPGGQPVASTSRAPVFSYEDERQRSGRKASRGHDRAPSPPTYTRPEPPVAAEDLNIGYQRQQPKPVRQNLNEGQHTRPRRQSPHRHSPTPPSHLQGDPVGQRVMALHPGAAQRLASTGDHQSPHHSCQPQQGILRPDSRSASRSPSPGLPEDSHQPGAVSFARGSSHSPPQPRYGPRLSPHLSGAGSRDRSRSPKPGSRHGSPQPASPKHSRSGKRGTNIRASEEEEELMQVTCV